MKCESCGEECARGYYGPVCPLCQIIYVTPAEDADMIEVRQR